jgi:hypothetical protein
MSWPELLYDTLTRRAMPETVAGIITENLGKGWRGDWKPDELVLLRRAAASRPSWFVSSMPEDFETVPGCTANIATALNVHGVYAEPGAIEEMAHDAAAIAQLVDELGEPIGWRHGQDWKAQRLTAAQRDADWYPEALRGHRIYNKRIRVLRNLSDHAGRMAARQAFRRLILIGRSGFAVDIGRDRFTADPKAAAFIAYYTARKNRRRLFTLSAKENPVDDIAAMLLERCERSLSTDWQMIAMVCPQPVVLRHLDDSQIGELMGAWWTVMADAAGQLETAWPGEDVNRLRMVVRRGMDSSTWNTTAQAYNAARAAWINCTTLVGAQALTGPYLPGKVMRLMAADLAWWHQASGSGVDPDTQVWARLPFPWDVIRGVADCTLADVEAACAEAGIDPVARGWTGPHAPGKHAVFTPTPDLVHGVEVADPSWAALLRRAGVFSGKFVTDEAAKLRALADEAEVITGNLPVYDGLTGEYLGTKKSPIQ